MSDVYIAPRNGMYNYVWKEIFEMMCLDDTIVTPQKSSSEPFRLLYILEECTSRLGEWNIKNADKRGNDCKHLIVFAVKEDNRRQKHAFDHTINNAKDQYTCIPIDAYREENVYHIHPCDHNRRALAELKEFLMKTYQYKEKQQEPKKATDEKEQAKDAKIVHVTTITTQFDIPAQELQLAPEMFQTACESGHISGDSYAFVYIFNFLRAKDRGVKFNQATLPDKPYKLERIIEEAKWWQFEELVTIVQQERNKKLNHQIV